MPTWWAREGVLIERSRAAGRRVRHEPARWQRARPPRVGARIATPGEWIFLTGFGTIADSVRALRLGAFDFLEKPCDPKRLDLVVAGAARSARAQRRLLDHANRNRRTRSRPSWGSSPAAVEIRA